MDVDLYDAASKAAESVKFCIDEARRHERRRIMYDLGPLLCRRHECPGDCEGPLVYDYAKNGRAVPVCAHHLPFLASEGGTTRVAP